MLDRLTLYLDLIRWNRPAGWLRALGGGATMTTCWYCGEAAPPPPPEEPGVEVVVSNTGKRYALMSGATWVIEGTDKAGQPFRREYNSDEVSKTVGVGYLAPGGGRRRPATGRWPGRRP